MVNAMQWLGISVLFISHFWWDLNKTPTTVGRIAFELPIAHPHFGFAGPARRLTPGFATRHVTLGLIAFGWPA